MRKEDFKEWLSTKIKKKPTSDCMSRCKAVETAFEIKNNRQKKKCGNIRNWTDRKTEKNN